MPPSPPGVRRREEYSDKRGKGSLVDELANAPDLELKCRHHGGNKGAGSRSGQGPEEKTRSWLEEAGWQQPGSLTLAAAQAAFAISSSPQYRLCVCRSGGFHAGSGLRLHRKVGAAKCETACTCYADTTSTAHTLGVLVGGSYGLATWWSQQKKKAPAAAPSVSAAAPTCPASPKSPCTRQKTKRTTTPSVDHPDSDTVESRVVRGPQLRRQTAVCSARQPTAPSSTQATTPHPKHARLYTAEEVAAAALLAGFAQTPHTGPAPHHCS